MIFHCLNVERRKCGFGYLTFRMTDVLLYFNFLVTLAKLWKATTSFSMSVRPSVWMSTQNNSAPNKRVSLNFNIGIFLENLSRKFKFLSYRTRITCTLHEDQYIFFIISCSILLRMRNVSHKSCRENQYMPCMFNNFFFFSENRALCKLMWKNFRARQTTDDNTVNVYYMLDTYGKNTHSEHITLIAFRLQQWLHNCPSTLCYMSCYFLKTV